MQSRKLMFLIYVVFIFEISQPKVNGLRCTKEDFKVGKSTSVDQDKEDYLWKVTSEDIPVESYLFGSMDAPAKMILRFRVDHGVSVNRRGFWGVN